jgi:hypothetical protein
MNPQLLMCSTPHSPLSSVEEERNPTADRLQIFARPASDAIERFLDIFD